MKKAYKSDLVLNFIYLHYIFTLLTFIIITASIFFTSLKIIRLLKKILIIL